MSIAVTWHGHSNFQIADQSVNILIDPFFSHNPVAKTAWQAIPKPDLVLVTHDHGDHIGDAVAICKATGALCGCVVGTSTFLIESGIPPEQIPGGGSGFNIGGSIEVKGARVTMTEAFHTSETGAPVGYIITLSGGFTIYHAGDTGIFRNMELLGDLYPIDLALLPIGGFYTMDAYQAAHAAKLLKARHVMPMHWGTFPIIAPDPVDFVSQVEQIAPATRPVLLQPGETATF